MITRLPSFSSYEYEGQYKAEHSASIAQADTKEKQDAINVAYRAASAQETKRIDKEREKVAAQNAATFLADPRAVLALLDEERGRTFDLGEMILIYGIATVKAKRGGKGYKVCKGTIGEGTMSPFDMTVKIGDRTKVIETFSRNDRHSKRDNESFAAARAALDIAQEIAPLI